MAGEPDYRRGASSRFQFLKTALNDADVVQGVVRAVWPKVARAEADFECWLHRGLHAVSGGVQKWIWRLGTNNHAFLSPNIGLHPNMAGHVFVLHSHSVADAIWGARPGGFALPNYTITRGTTWPSRLARGHLSKSPAYPSTH